jgi:hypothetical protein
VWHGFTIAPLVKQIVERCASANAAASRAALTACGVL